MFRSFAVTLLCATPLGASGAPQSPAEKFAALKKEHEAAQAAYSQASQALKDTPADQKKSEEMWAAFDKAQGERFLAALEIAKADVKSDITLAALEWVLTIPRAYYLPAGIPAMELTAAHHAANPKVGTIVARLGASPPHFGSYPKESVAAMALLRAVAEKNSDRTVRGQAALGLAWDAARKFAVAEYKREKGADKLATDAERAFEAVLKDYGDCPRLGRDHTLGDEAKQELYELRHLRVGKTAPDIEAEGVDGTTFKLSDYRGKVVAVVFWASWCGPCMREVPHERELVARLKDRPFALVGVNGDDTREKAKEVMAKEKMTWPSFWNGSDDPAGPLARAWNVRGWPTQYVLDAKGVIRFKNIRGNELAAAIDELLKEMDDEKKSK